MTITVWSIAARYDNSGRRSRQCPFAIVYQLQRRVMQRAGQYPAITGRDYPYVARIGPHAARCLALTLYAVDVNHSDSTVTITAAGASTATM